MQRTHAVGLTLLILALSGQGACWAQSEDWIKLRSSLTIANDDNFLRTSNATAVSERTTTQALGVNVSIPLSLQRFTLDAGLTGSQHQNYTNFDYIGQNYNGAWLWSITPDFHGSLTSTRAETLNAASDSLNPNLRNKNTTTNTAFNSAYELNGAWRLSAGLSASNSENEQALTIPGDNRSTAYNGGIQYQFSSGNALGYVFQRSVGNATNDYTSTTHEVNMVWVLSGNSTLNAKLGQLDQQFASAPHFNFGGTTGSANFTWRATGKVTVNASWQRTLGSYSTTGTTHARTDTFSLAPSWQMTSKTSMQLKYLSTRRDDQGNPFGTASTRQDQMQDTSLSLQWAPRPAASLSATLTESRRSSNLANIDFVSHQAALAAMFTF